MSVKEFEVLGDLFARGDGKTDMAGQSRLTTRQYRAQGLVATGRTGGSECFIFVYAGNNHFLFYTCINIYIYINFPYLPFYHSVRKFLYTKLLIMKLTSYYKQNLFLML